MLDLIIVILFLSINLLIGYLTSKSIVKFEHFSVGKRSFTTFFIFCSISATFIGGGYTIGNSASVYTMGMVYAFALLGFSLKEILVGSLIAPRMTRYTACHTVGDIIEMTYGKKAKFITGIFSLLICGGILGAQIGALNAVFEISIGGVNPMLATIISFVVLLIYAALGGMKAVILTDTFQFLILIIGIPLTFFIGLHHIGGWHHIAQATPTNYLHFLTNGHAWLFFILLFVTFIFGETLVPPYVQRLFMAKQTQYTARGLVLSGILSIPVFLICGAIGLIAYVSNQHLSGNEPFIYVVNTMVPVGIKGFILASMLSIILSSAAGFLNAASISFVNDIIKPVKPNYPDKHLLFLARASTIIVGIIAVVFALAIKNVLSILLAAYNFWSPIILVPLIFAIFGLKARSRDFFAGATAGIIASLIWEYAFHTPFGVSPILFGIMCNLIAFLTSRFILVKPIAL